MNYLENTVFCHYLLSEVTFVLADYIELILISLSPDSNRLEMSVTQICMTVLH